MVIYMKVLKKGTINLLNILKIIIEFLLEKKYILFTSLPLIAMDLITRIYGYNIDFYKIYNLTKVLLSYMTKSAF